MPQTRQDVGNGLANKPRKQQHSSARRQSRVHKACLFE
jgi:hypothetical protein